MGHRITRLDRPFKRLITIGEHEVLMELVKRDGTWWMSVRAKGVRKARIRWRKLSDVLRDSFFMDLIGQPTLQAASDGR